VEKPSILPHQLGGVEWLKTMLRLADGLGPLVPKLQSCFPGEDRGKKRGLRRENVGVRMLPKGKKKSIWLGGGVLLGGTKKAN